LVVALLAGGAFALTRDDEDEADKPSPTTTTQAAEESDVSELTDDSDATDATDASDESDFSDATDASDESSFGDPEINAVLERSLLTPAEIAPGIAEDPTFNSETGDSPCGEEDVDLQVPPDGATDAGYVNEDSSQAVLHLIRQYDRPATAKDAFDAFLSGVTCPAPEIDGAPATITPATDVTANVPGTDWASSLTLTLDNVAQTVVIANAGDKLVAIFSIAEVGQPAIDPVPLIQKAVSKLP
jgi:hypothetical protein